MGEPAQFALAALLHLILIAAVVQAWMSAWPGKTWLTIGAVIAVGASIALFRPWRSAPLIIACIAVAALFLWAALLFGSDAGGLKIAGLPFGTATAVLIIVALGIAAWQLWKLTSSPRLPPWVRFIPAAFALYAIALIVLGLVRGANPSGVIAGDGPVPWWMSGSYIGSAVLLPIGFLVALVTLGMSIAKRRAGAITGVGVLVLMLSAFGLSGIELTRNGRPNIAQFIVPGSLTGSSPLVEGSTTTAGGPTVSLGAGETSLAPYEGKDIDDIFARVATGVRFEPYSGILRGAIGTAIARSGNSADQSMLLAEVLRRAGYKVRFARGTLPDNNIDALVRGMYPPGIAVEQLGPEYAPYDPAADTELRTLVRDHVWVEVFQGESWLPLDPSFPRAKIGEAYAEGSEQFDDPADALYHRLEATLREETVNGQSRELGRFVGTVADLGTKPVSLVVRAIPQSSGGTVEQTTGGPAGTIGGMGGALGGETEAPPPEPQKKTTPKTVVGVAYVRDLSVGGVPQKLLRTSVRNGDAGAGIKREWIEFNLTGPGSPPRRVERVLFQSDQTSKPVPLERRYTITILSGRIPRSFADEQTRLASSLVNVEDFEQKARRFGNVSADDPKARDAAVELGRMGDALGTVAGHLLALRFASESDSLSRRIADGNGIALAWSTPRILIVGVEMTGKEKGKMDATVSLDLRLDEIHAYPYPQAPARIVQIFKMARGIQESVIEGRLVALTTGREPSANTAQLVNVAQTQGVPLVVINASTRSQLGQLAPGVPVTCVQMMDAAIAQGKEIVVPSRAIAIAGEPRWGWWEVDPASGSVVGVMQDGQHQAMADYTISSEEIGLNDESGQILGMMMGSITTVGTLSALMLKYGSATPELIKELEEFLKQILCNSCIESAGVKASVSGPSVSTGSVGNECYSASKKFGGKVEVGGEIKNSFCEAYGEGFKCSSGLILRVLKNESLVTTTEAKIEWGSAESEAKIGCVDAGG